MNSGGHPFEAEMARWRDINALLHRLELDQGSPQPAPLYEPEPSAQPMPAEEVISAAPSLSVNGNLSLPAEAQPARVFDINPKAIRASTFFENLSWEQPHPGDPGDGLEALLVPKVQLVDNQLDKPETSRNFFACEVPWAGRGTEPQPPDQFDEEGHGPLPILGRGDFARTALQTAMHSATRGSDVNMRPRHASLASPRAGSASDFFETLDWNSRPPNGADASHLSNTP